MCPVLWGIISGDEHLLRLGNYKEAKIIPVGKFLDLLAREAKDLINEVEQSVRDFVGRDKRLAGVDEGGKGVYGEVVGDGSEDGDGS